MLYTSIKYVQEDPIFEEEQPYELFGFPNETSGKITNCNYHVVDGIPLNDLRASPDGKSLTLLSSGFQYFQHKSDIPLDARYFESTAESVQNDVAQRYLDENMEAVKRFTGAKRVICLDWRFRRSGPKEEVMIAPTDVMEVRKQALPPGLTMHCDFSHLGGQDRLDMHLTSEELRQYRDGECRVKIINSWRPFFEVQNAPLIISDRRSVKRSDLVEVDKVLPDKVERAYYLFHRQHHQWYYMSHQRPDELALFTTWSSEEETDFADFPPHGAATLFEGGPPRESIEVRLICLFDPKDPY